MLDKSKLYDYAAMLTASELKEVLDTFDFSSKDNYNLSLVYNMILNIIRTWNVKGLHPNKLRRKLHTILKLSEGSKLYDFWEEKKVNRYLSNQKIPYILFFGSPAYVVHEIDYRWIGAFLAMCIEIIQSSEGDEKISSNMRAVSKNVLQIFKDKKWLQ